MLNDANCRLLFILGRSLKKYIITQIYNFYSCFSILSANYYVIHFFLPLYIHTRK